LKKAVIVCATLATLASLFFMPVVLGHAPLGVKDNEKIGSATLIPDPTKSWALYYALNSDGDAQYYTFNITVGQRVHVILLKSMEANDSYFLPMVAILGPGLTNQGTLPSKVTLPEGYNWQAISSGHPSPTYEPFSPSSFYGLSDTAFNAPSSGQYYVVVFENSSAPTGGHYGLAIGDRESYTIDEWVLLPLSLLGIYAWEGQTLLEIVAPMIATVAVGLFLVAWYLRKRGRARNIFSWVGSIAGLILVGSGADTMLQMLIANNGAFGGVQILITSVFVALPIVLGLIALRISLRKADGIGIKHRIYFVIIGVSALFLLAGLFIGPTVAIVGSFMPTQR
jgi:hypothetical protein